MALLFARERPLSKLAVRTFELSRCSWWLALCTSHISACAARELDVLTTPLQTFARRVAMLSRVRALRQIAPRGARLLAQQADAVTPYRELASTTAAQREVSARPTLRDSRVLCTPTRALLCLEQPKQEAPSCMVTTILTATGVGHAG